MRERKYSKGIPDQPGRFFLLYLVLGLWVGIIGWFGGDPEDTILNVPQDEFLVGAGLVLVFAGIVVPPLYRLFGASGD